MKVAFYFGNVNLDNLFGTFSAELLATKKSLDKRRRMSPIGQLELAGMMLSHSFCSGGPKFGIVRVMDKVSLTSQHDTTTPRSLSMCSRQLA